MFNNNNENNEFFLFNESNNSIFFSNDSIIESLQQNFQVNQNSSISLIIRSNMFDNFSESNNNSQDIYNLFNSNNNNNNDNNNNNNNFNDYLFGLFISFQDKINDESYENDFNFDNNIKIIKKIISRNDVDDKKIKIFYNLEFKIDNYNYFYKPIKKEFIINNLNSNYLSSQKIKLKLNYIDKFYRILIERDKIEFNIELEDDKNNHCYFPIGLYERKSNKLIYNNIIIFSIIIYD